MTSHSENTKRIAKNTLMLYARMLFSMLVSLYTSRVILNALGVEDYGIYNVVGGFVAMFSMISGSLSASVSRFLTFELGKNDIEGLKKTFSTSIFIHILLAFIILLFAETLGVWFMNEFMTIPTNRLCAANWVFQASVFSFIVGLLSVPYNASIVSHERMGTFAYIGILAIVLRLVAVLFVAYSPFVFDRLIVYSIAVVCIGLIIQSVYFFYCRSHFIECRGKLQYDKGYWKNMITFAGWNFIGSSSGLLKEQGVNVLLNIFIGPIINAARGIATSVNNAVCAFSSNFMTALNPQVTKSYAAGDKDYAFSLVERGARFSFYIILLLAMPVLVETDYVLTLWLKNYPEHTVNFVRLVLILSLCDVLSRTLITLQLATGNIRNYQLVVGGVQLLNFPISYLFLKIGFAPEVTFVIAIFISCICLILRLKFLQVMVGLPIGRFLRNVCLRAIGIFALASLVPIILHENLPFGWGRFIVVAFLSSFCVCFFVYKIGCIKSERVYIYNKVVSLKRFFK